MYNEKYTKRYNAIPYTKTREGRKKLRLAEKLVKFTEYAQEISRPRFPIFDTWAEVVTYLKYIFRKTFKSELKSKEADKLNYWFFIHIRYKNYWCDIAFDYWDTVKGCVVHRYLE